MSDTVVSLTGRPVEDSMRNRLINSFAASYDTAVANGIEPTGAVYVFISDKAGMHRGFDMTGCAIPTGPALAYAALWANVCLHSQFEETS